MGASLLGPGGRRDLGEGRRHPGTARSGGLMVYAGTGIVSQGRRAGPLRLGSLTRFRPPLSLLGRGRHVHRRLDRLRDSERRPLARRLVRDGPDHPLGDQSERHEDPRCPLPLGGEISRSEDRHDLAGALVHGDSLRPLDSDQARNRFVPRMSMVHVILKEGLVNEAFIKEQTDLPFLVRKDSGRLLQRLDLKKFPARTSLLLGSEEERARRGPGDDGAREGHVAPERNRSGLTGSFEVKGKDGQPIAVTTVFRARPGRGREVLPEATGEDHGDRPLPVVVKLTPNSPKRRRPGSRSGSRPQVRMGRARVLGAGWHAPSRATRPRRAASTRSTSGSLGGSAPLNPKPAPGSLPASSPSGCPGGCGRRLATHYSTRRSSPSGAGSRPPRSSKIADEPGEEMARLVRRTAGRILFGDNMFRRNKAQGPLPQSRPRPDRSLRQRQLPDGLVGRAGRPSSPPRATTHEGWGHPSEVSIPPLREPHRPAARSQNRRRGEERSEICDFSLSGSGARRSSGASRLADPVSP